uniref:Uncharacterized protein n=1 Tax=Ascaris lumbricoides TaxID=6252 RepID=A0A0M3I6T4_ASCLU
MRRSSNNRYLSLLCRQVLYLCRKYLLFLPIAFL